MVVNLNRLAAEQEFGQRFYAGLEIGTGFGSVSHAEYEKGYGFDGFTFDGNDTSAVGGAFLGFNAIDNENYTLGIEGDLSFSSLYHKGNLYYFGSPDVSYTDAWRSGPQGALRLRAGMKAGQALIYATAGVAAGQNSFDIYGTNLTTNPDSFDRFMLGWTVGAGVEYPVNDSWDLRLEYRYVDFGSVLLEANVLGYLGEYIDDFNVQHHKLSVGFSHSF